MSEDAGDGNEIVIGVEEPEGKRREHDGVQQGIGRELAVQSLDELQEERAVEAATVVDDKVERNTRTETKFHRLGTGRRWRTKR